MIRTAQRAVRWIGMAALMLHALPVLLIMVEVGALARGEPFVTATVESLVGPICHHAPARTAVLGKPLPVCARCTGLYGGWLLSLPAVVLAVGWRQARHHLARHRGSLAVLLAALFAVAVAEAILEMAGVVATSNAVRVILGVPLGLAPAAVLLGGAWLLLEEPPVPIC